MKIINIKYKRLVLLLGLVVFITEFTLTPFLHNHTPDLKTHNDCPAYIISSTQQSISFSFTTNLVKYTSVVGYLPKLNKLGNIPSLHLSSYFNKAPPYFL